MESRISTSYRLEEMRIDHEVSEVTKSMVSPFVLVLFFFRREFSQEVWESLFQTHKTQQSKMYQLSRYEDVFDLPTRRN